MQFVSEQFLVRTIRSCHEPRLTTTLLIGGQNDCRIADGHTRLHAFSVQSFDYTDIHKLWIDASMNHRDITRVTQFTVPGSSPQHGRSLINDMAHNIQLQTEVFRCLLIHSTVAPPCPKACFTASSSRPKQETATNSKSQLVLPHVPAQGQDQAKKKKRISSRD